MELGSYYTRHLLGLMRFITIRRVLHGQSTPPLLKLSLLQQFIVQFGNQLSKSPIHQT